MLQVPPAPTMLSPVIWYIWKEVSVKKKKKSQGKFPPPLLPFTPLHSNYILDGHVILQCLYVIKNQIAFTTGNEKGRGEVSIQI